MILLYHIFRVLSIYFCGVLWEATQHETLNEALVDIVKMVRDVAEEIVEL